MRSKTSQIYRPFILFILIIFLNSCNKDLIETNNWSPELIIPLTNVKLTLADLIPEKGSVVYDEDNFIRLAYLLPIRAKNFVEAEAELQQAMLGSNNMSLDPTAVLGFGFVGLWFLVTNYVSMDDEGFKKELSYIGMLGGMLHILVPIGTVFNIQILVTIAAGLGGIILGPVWYIWLGIIMQKKR